MRKELEGEKSHENVIPLRDGQQPLFRAKIDFLNGKKEEKVFGANFPVALKRQMQIVSIEYYGEKVFRKLPRNLFIGHFSIFMGRIQTRKLKSATKKE